MKLIIDIDEKLVCEGFERIFTEEERDILIRAIGHGTPYEDRPTGKWISVKDKPPEEMQKVLVWFEYYRYGDYNCMYQTYGFCYVCDGKWSSFINGESGWKDARIIAWQPLPEPYKEAENDLG